MLVNRVKIISPTSKARMVFTFPLLLKKDNSQSPKATPTAILQRKSMDRMTIRDNTAKGMPMMTKESIKNIMKTTNIQIKKIKPIAKLLKGEFLRLALMR